MRKKTVVIVSLIIILILIVICISIYFYLISAPFRRDYSLRLTPEHFSGSDIAIDLPKKWVMFDVVERDPERDEKESDERYLLVTGSYFGGFPHIEIYGVELDDLSNSGDDYQKMCIWNQVRLQKAESENEIIFDKTIDYEDGQLMTYISDSPMMTYISDSPKTDEYPRELCKDWIYIKANTGYLVSICEIEDHWDKLNLIYEEIIQSFEVAPQ